MTTKILELNAAGLYSLGILNRETIKNGLSLERKNGVEEKYQNILQKNGSNSIYAFKHCIEK